MTAGRPRIDELLAEARDRRHCYDLYRAKLYGSRPPTIARLRELERACQAAEARLRQAQRDGAPPDRG